MFVCLECQTAFDTSQSGQCPSCGGLVVPDPEHDPLLETVVDARYELLAVLGEGGMGTVYRARHLGHGGEVALKVLKQAIRTRSHAYERFYREGRAVGRLRHPNSVRVTDVGSLPDGRPYLVMELVDGVPLKELGRPLPLGRAVRLVRQLLGALEEAHAAGVVHRDLKPDNVLVSEVDGEDFVRVVDYGVAKLVDGASELTVDGATPGTPGYIAPELLRGEPVEARSDLYSVGVILYELVSGQHPFSAADKRTLLEAHQSQRPTPPGERRQLPKRLDRLILACLAKRPEDRPPSAAAVRATLDEVLVELSDGEAARAGVSPEALGTSWSQLDTQSRTEPGAAPMSDAEPSRAAAPTGRRRVRMAGLVVVAAALGLTGLALALWPGAVEPSRGATPAAAAAPAPTEWIYAIRGGEIWRLTPEGEGLRRLTDTPAGGRITSLAVDPGGQRLAWVEMNEPFSDDNRLVTARGDGSDATTVTTVATQGVAFACDVHPTLGRLLFGEDIGPGPAENSELFEVALDGSHRRRLTDHPDNERCGRYTADGTQIVLQSGRIRCGTCGRIDVMAWDGSGRHPLVDRSDGPVLSPDVSDDGLIVYALRLEGRLDLWRVGLDGREAQPFPPTPELDEVSPRWSPDGRHLVFVSGGDTWSMAADGSGGRLLLAGAGAAQWTRAAPLRRELLANGDFDLPLDEGWHRPEGRPLHEAAVVEVVDQPGHPTALHLDSRVGDNHYETFAARVDVSGLPLTSLELAWSWRVDAMESPWGRAEVTVLFFDDPDSESAVGAFTHQRTGDSPDNRCTSGAAHYCVDDSTTFTPGAWSTHRHPLADLLSEMPGLDPEAIVGIEVWLTSYNNAGDGADAWFDGVSVAVLEP